MSMYEWYLDYRIHGLVHRDINNSPVCTSGPLLPNRPPFTALVVAGYYVKSLGAKLGNFSFVARNGY